MPAPSNRRISCCWPVRPSLWRPALRATSWCWLCCVSSRSFRPRRRRRKRFSGSMAVAVCARALHWTTKVALVVHIDDLEFHRPRVGVHGLERCPRVRIDWAHVSCKRSDVTWIGLSICSNDDLHTPRLLHVVRMRAGGALLQDQWLYDKIAQDLLGMKHWHVPHPPILT